MSYTIVIGQYLVQPLNEGKVVPQYTAIIDDFCFTIISCVGQAPEQLKFDEPVVAMCRHEWKSFLMSSKSLRKFAAYTDKSKSQIIHLNQPEILEILEQIKVKTLKIKDSYHRNLAEWLVFWTEESVKRYEQNAAIGLF